VCVCILSMYTYAQTHTHIYINHPMHNSDVDDADSLFEPISI
jgi:hypothetical protein